MTSTVPTRFTFIIRIYISHSTLYSLLKVQVMNWYLHGHFYFLYGFFFTEEAVLRIFKRLSFKRKLFLNPVPPGKYCVHFNIVLLNVTAHRWLCQCVATYKSISRPLTSPDITFPWVCGENAFCTNAISFDTVIFIINSIITIVLLTIITAISIARKYYWTSRKRGKQVRQVILVIGSLVT